MTPSWIREVTTRVDQQWDRPFVFVSVLLLVCGDGLPVKFDSQTRAIRHLNAAVLDDRFLADEQIVPPWHLARVVL
jgi:hypothetical protein